jgi:hypothetical protein
MIEEIVITQELLTSTVERRKRSWAQAQKAGRGAVWFKGVADGIHSHFPFLVRGFDMGLKDDYRFHFRQDIFELWCNLRCVGCGKVFKMGEKALFVAKNAVYIHPDQRCLDMLKTHNEKLYKYSGLRKRFEGDQARERKVSELDERDKHLYDTPQSSRRL